MEGIKLAIDFVRAIVWPVLIWGIALLFKNEFKRLIGRIKEINTPWGPVKMGEIIAEIQKDIDCESTPEVITKISNESKKPVRITNISRGLNFERKTLALLGTSSKLFDAFSIKTNVGLTLNGARFVFDALATSEGINYIIEVKGSNHLNVIEYGKQQLMAYIETYANNFLETNLEIRHAKGILIVPDCDTPDFYGNSIAVLKYDTETNKFTNEDLVAKWING